MKTRKGFSLMKIIPNYPDMPIVNLDQLPHGVGARYLECIQSHDKTAIIAKCWRKSVPKHYEILVDMNWTKYPKEIV